MIKKEWAILVCIILGCAVVLLNLVSQYLACDGTFVRTLFWFECIK